VACSSKKSTIVICVQGLNGKAFKEAGKRNTVTNRVSYGNVANGSSASMIEQVLGFDDVKELGAQAHQRQFYYSRYVRNGHDNRHCPNGRG
jgi:uncharacterized protein YidB (DUF937 family)